MFNPIIISQDGFEISDFKKQNLANVGALFFLRFVGYLNNPEIKKVVDKNPDMLQSHIKALKENSQSKIAQGHRIKEDNYGIEIFVCQSVFSPQGEYTLYINIQKKDFLRAKRILYALFN